MMPCDKKEIDSELVLHESTKFLLDHPELWPFTSMHDWPRLEMDLVLPVIGRVAGIGMVFYAIFNI